MEMIGQGLKALDQKTQEPLECDTHRATNTAQRHPFHQQAFDKTSLVIRDEVLLVGPGVAKAEILTKCFYKRNSNGL